MINALWDFIAQNFDALDLLYILTAFAFAWDQIDMMYQVEEYTDALDEKYSRYIKALKKQNKQLKERVEQYEQQNT